MGHEFRSQDFALFLKSCFRNPDFIPLIKHMICGGGQDLLSCSGDTGMGGPLLTIVHNQERRRFLTGSKLL